MPFSFLRIAFLLAAVTCLGGRAFALVEAEEHHVKAAFIYNFMKFVEWPPDRPEASSPSHNLCIVGEDRFGEHINSLQGKSAAGKKIRIRRTDGNNLKDCHTLFICESESGRVERILESIRVFPILTIGDTKGFAQKGVIINMFMEDEKIRFEVSLKSAKQRGFRIDSRLLKLARILRGN